MSASELLRVVAVKHVTEPPSRVSPGEAAFSVEPDPGRRRPGRGAHLHPDLACFALAERRRAFGRALRLTGVLDTGPLAEHIARQRPGTSEPPMVGQTTPDQQGRTTNMSTR